MCLMRPIGGRANTIFREGGPWGLPRLRFELVWCEP